MSLHEIRFENEFDGIWACASLLHVPRQELEAALGKLVRALRPNGLFYVSFKHGDSERMESGRFFNDLTEGLLRGIFDTQAELELIRVWMTDDARKKRREQRWLNAIARRCVAAK